ncbi:MAG TPA: hypothetical protein VIO64_20435 [Pseudobacteroides sp.]|uniref:hypothetical protein n=1 Tax=Pseudobacteroides sp. TaxID=1968840 RepID=UPI002F92ADD6
MLKKVYALVISLALVNILVGNFSFAGETKNPGFKISGYVDSDFSYSKTASPYVKSGFKIEICGGKYNDLTDESGYFEIILPADTDN